MSFPAHRAQHAAHGSTPDSPRRLILLGSTGSIGVNTLEVVEHLNSHNLMRIEVVGLATGSNIDAVREQSAKLGVKHVAVAHQEGGNDFPSTTTVFRGADAALQLIEAVAQPGDLVVGAMVGSAGIPATLAAIERGCDIALANKETLVAAGSLVMPAVRSRGINLLPIDSEHSAIFQCLVSEAERGSSSVARIVLTASGGPFRTWPTERMSNATVEEALNHPTWNMGPKVTIDSASLMNKALEIIEAHWLFGMPAEKIGVIIHPQSIVHSFVEFTDGSVLAQLGPPDMRTPIQHAITWPRRVEGCSRKMNMSNAWNLDFEPLDAKRFAAPGLAREVIASGGTSGAVFNAANEAAVAAFLQRRIGFGHILELVAGALEAIPARPVRTIADVHYADAEARAYVQGRLAAGGPASAAANFAGSRIKQ